MEITDAEREKFIADLTEIKNLTEGQCFRLQDMNLELDEVETRAGEMLDVLAMIARRPAEDPS